jgi:hypothetical protein
LPVAQAHGIPVLVLDPEARELDEDELRRHGFASYFFFKNV